MYKARDHTAHSKGSSMPGMRQSSGEGRQATPEVWAAGNFVSEFSTCVSE